MHSFRYQKGSLNCENVDLAQIAAEHGTPVYVYSAETIRDHYRRLDEALQPLDHLICYAVKANANLAVLNLLVRERAGFDIVSAGELFRVTRAGGKPECCTFAGVGKTRPEIEFALRQGILSFNIESESELELINAVAGEMQRRAPIALRVNPNVAGGGHKYISTGKSESKFGVGLERALEVYAAAARLPHIRIRGVQMHIGSQITDAATFVHAVKKVAPLALELKRAHGIEFFSVGGGLGIVYQGSLESGQVEWWQQEPGASASLSVEDYAEAIIPTLAPLGLRILLEPGRFMVGNAGVLLTQVQYLKTSDSGKKFVIVDAGMNDLIRPALYQGYHEIVPVREPAAAAPREIADVVGPVCESGDFFAQARELPPLRQGELAALMSAGAYGFAMASNYNARPMPAEVLVCDGQAHLVRERQTFNDLVRGEHLAPDQLPAYAFDVP
jgi:diaminopimelate decarboxylase